ncbi:Cmx/CmrA family chloramphenicol efflux MFS transporter [Streptomyces sp. MP131-18]|uniref:Cmx/CmrA family chloramphenicol efflux MFS transporter n=1 Tax=Streptomyces sp. MP131-18 TaxID=1857892 RepID=UPI0025B76B31|nr:Cmx/CmrA family chloramphenicol efflux MFS transporter [Streptomyces sp. MP131-18]
MSAHPTTPTGSTAPPARLPLAVYVIGAAIFALGTSEFMLSGLLPEVADDLDVSIPTAGLLISAFAIGMVVGAPVLAAATQRLPRRTTLVGLLAVFALGHVVGALAPGYAVLFVCRVVSALACAGFWAVGAAVAISLVPAHARARTMAVMIGGLSIANIAGVPGGAALGQSLGWRSAFWAVALMTAVGLVGVLLFVPRTSPRDDASERPALRTELRVYRNPQVWLAMATTALFAAGTFCFFSYLAPLLTDVTGLGEGWVPVVLVLYGVGALIGTALGGRLADAHMFGTLYSGLTAAVVVLALVAMTAQYAVAVVLLSALLGLAAFLCAPGLNARIFDVASGAPTLAGATATSSFNAGNTVGPWAGGLVISGGLGYAWTAWLGALLVLGALAGAWLQSRGTRPARVIATGERRAAAPSTVEAAHKP